MSRHRSPGAPNAEESSPHDPPSQNSRRFSTPPSVIRGRIVVAAVAAGAFAAAGQSIANGEPAPDSDGVQPLASGQDAAASFGSATDSSTGMGGSAPAPEVLPVTKNTDTGSEVEKLAKSQQIAGERAAAEAARIAAEEEAKRPQVVKPAQGSFTSGFGGRWGSTHYGIDIANSKGTPIVSAMDGTVIDAGPASGFGLWVRVQHNDGTITVYGHVNSITADEGDQVKAGDQIATMGNRGFSTGTHLHFEVWNASGKKINPLPWLSERGINLT